MSNRREFLKNMAGAAAAIFLAGWERMNASASLPQAAAPVKRREISVGGRRVKTVDLHCHCYPDIRDLMKGHEQEGRGANGFLDPSRRFTMLETDKIADRLSFMDEHGIDVQAVSLFPAYNYWADRDLAERIAQRQNEQLASLCTAHPDRFVGLGSLSLQHPDLTVEQMDQGVKKLGFRGFVIGGSVNGEDLSAPKFDPFWAKAEELGIILFMHPEGFAEGQARFRGNGNLGNVIGNPLETTVALSHLIFEGVLDRHPGVKIVAAHGGGFIASYLGRSNHCVEKNPSGCKPLKKMPGEYFKEQIFCDSIVFTPEGLRHLVAEVGVGHVVFGTDFPADVTDPHMGDDREADFILSSGLSAADQRAILGENAAKILRIPS
jgi:aminocarboxymuconate-semialdehyde decarboxylase